MKMSKEQELQMGMRCVKYMIFVANFMFMLVGFLLISIGYTIKAIYTDFDAFLTSHSYKASDLAMAVGIIILIVALFGCVGAARQSVCLINIYAMFLLIIVILEIAVTVTAYKSRSDLRLTLREDMKISMDYFETDTNYIWNAAQYSLRCCGVDSYNDWQKYDELPGNPYNLTYVSDNSTAIPNTCCFSEQCSGINSVYKNGCLPKITYIITQSALLLGVGAMCITFIQILGAIFAHLLARSIRKLKTQIELERSMRRQQLYEQLAKANTEEQKVSPVLYVPSSSEA